MATGHTAAAEQRPAAPVATAADDHASAPAPQHESPVAPPTTVEDTTLVRNDPSGFPAAPGLKPRGAFFLALAPALVAGLIGFVTSGTTTIPTLTGWGLFFGSVAAAAMSPHRLGWIAAWTPPLAALTAVVILGQVTMLGSMPTLAREAAMIAAGLTALAPAQVASVVAAAVVLWLKRRVLARG